MHVVHVKIFTLQVFDSLLTRLPYFIWGVVGVVQLACYPNVFPGKFAFVEYPGKSFADDLLVAIVGRAVDMPACMHTSA